MIINGESPSDSQDGERSVAPSNSTNKDLATNPRVDRGIVSRVQQVECEKVRSCCTSTSRDSIAVFRQQQWEPIRAFRGAALTTPRKPGTTSASPSPKVRMWGEIIQRQPCSAFGSIGRLVAHVVAYMRATSRRVARI
jgi:hypothetical protein